MSEVNPPAGSPDQPSSSVPPPPPPPTSGATAMPPPPPPPSSATGSAGYGAALPPPPAMAGSGQPFDLGSAFSWGWKKFQENIGPILIAVLVYLVILVVIQLLVVFGVSAALLSTPTTTIDPQTGAFTTTGGSGLFAVILVNALSIAVSVLVAAFLQAAVIRGGLMIANGRRLEVGHMFSFDNFGRVLGAAVIVALLTAVGVVFFYVGALVVYFFTAFTMFFVIDRDLDPLSAIKASANLAKNNVGAVVLLLLAVFAANVVGAIVCLIGLLVSIPVSYLAMTYGYRRLQNEPVAA